MFQLNYSDYPLQHYIMSWFLSGCICKNATRDCVLTTAGYDLRADHLVLLLSIFWWARRRRPCFVFLSHSHGEPGVEVTQLDVMWTLTTALHPSGCYHTCLGGDPLIVLCLRSARVVDCLAYRLLFLSLAYFATVLLLYRCFPAMLRPTISTSFEHDECRQDTHPARPLYAWCAVPTH